MAKTRNPRKPTRENQQNHDHQPQKTEKPHSWAVMRSLFTCKHRQAQIQQQQPHQQGQQKAQHQRQKHRQQKQEQNAEESSKKPKKIKCSGSLCSNTKVMYRPELLSSPEEQKKRASSMASCSNGGCTSNRSMKAPLSEVNGATVPSSSTSLVSAPSSSPFGGMPFRKLSGCYECRMVVHPVLGFTRDPSLRATICSCPECGEVFMKAERLELHQLTRHAVSELGHEDTGKKIVEIIFQSSWLRKQHPVCKIERILKIQNTPKIISRFEEYRDSIKAKATKFPKKHPRCVADGNEILRFHCTTFMCSLGLNGSSNLCNSVPNCNFCSIMKNGFKLPGEAAGKGILTTATSGKAHDNAGVGRDDEKRAMLVCRVIAGRVKKNLDRNTEYDSMAGVYSNLDELYVFNPKAILACFVVIYGGF